MKTFQTNYALGLSHPVTHLEPLTEGGIMANSFTTHKCAKCGNVERIALPPKQAKRKTTSRKASPKKQGMAGNLAAIAFILFVMWALLRDVIKTLFTQ